jgi:glutamate-5-semialdehyde dehydrogenase
MAVATVLKDDLEARVRDLALAAREAARALAVTPREAKDAALRAAARALREDRAQVEAENARDLRAAEGKGLTPAMLDRLRLDAKRIGAMADGLDAVADLPDPVGRELARWTRPNGLDIAREERKLSEPPRRMQALPALRQSAPASAVTLGRLS